MMGGACGTEMLTLPEHLISLLVFILSCLLCLLISCDCLCLLDFDFWLFLLFDCLVSIFLTLIRIHTYNIPASWITDDLFTQARIQDFGLAVGGGGPRTKFVGIKWKTNWVSISTYISLATLFYEWRKDISQQIWDSRNYQMTSHFVSRPPRFNSSDSHSPVSTQDFEFITKLNSHQFMNLLKSRLSPVWAYARCCN